MRASGERIRRTVASETLRILGRRDPKLAWLWLLRLILAWPFLHLALGRAMAEQDCAEISRDIAGRRIEHVPSLDLPDSCASGDSNYLNAKAVASPEAAEELHVIGVLEGSRPGRGSDEARENPDRTVEIRVRAQVKPVVLFLSAYESVEWVVKLDAGASVSRVVTQSHNEQRVVGLPAGVPVVHRSACTVSYGWELIHNDGGNGFAVMIESARRETGLTERSFQGCYTGDRFLVPHADGDPLPVVRPELLGDESISTSQVVFPGCEVVLREQGYCLTLGSGAIDVIGLESGAVCTVTKLQAPIHLVSSTSIAWRGEILYTCGGAGLTRISLRDGRFDAPQLPCAGLTSHPRGLLLLPAGSSGVQPVGIALYSDYRTLLDGKPRITYPWVPTNGSITADKRRVYSAWHSTSSIDVNDLATGALVRSIALEGYDDWIQGLSLDGGLFAVLGPSSDPAITLFDAVSGSRVRKIQLDPSSTMVGLACAIRGPLSDAGAGLGDGRRRRLPSVRRRSAGWP